MNTYVDKTQKNKSQAVSDANSQEQSGRESTFQFVDNRPETIAQRQLQAMANDSLQVKQATQLQAIVNKHSSKQQFIPKKENNTGLSGNLKTGMENLPGMSLDDVKVHHNSDKPVQRKPLPDAKIPIENAVIQRNFNPEDYNIKVAITDNDILLRALQTVMESPDYLAIARIISDGGGANVVYDDSIRGQAHWSSSDRTIRLNPRLIRQAKMVIAAILAFELGNASQDKEFQALLTKVATGEVADAGTYGKEAEKIEYQSAKIRACAAMKMIREGNWNKHNDPQLRHFIPMGEYIQSGLETILGDGLWLTFEGFYQTQVEVGHTAGHEARFAIMVPKSKKPAAATGKPSVDVEAARERYLERKLLNQNIVENKASGSTSMVAPMATSSQAEVRKKSQLIQIQDPSSFLVGSELTRFWEKDQKGNPYLGVDGKRYNLASYIEGTYYFREVS